MFRLFAPPVFGVLSYCVILLINNNVSQLAALFSNEEVYVSILLSLLSLESMRAVLVIFKFKALPRTQRLLWQSLLTTAVSVTMVLAAIAGYYHFFIGFDISLRELVIFGVIYLLTAILYNALYIGSQYLLLENTLRLEQERKMRENLESEFAAFRQEINPDLLYDSLEQLILSLRHEREAAEELIDSLAALYRYQLVNRHREFVPLEDELLAVRHLLRLLNQKHQHSIFWNNTVIRQESMEIIPGALVIAVDTVVRNTLISAQAPLVFTLSEEENEYLVLNHNLNDKLQTHSESLANFQRLQRSYSVYSELPFIQVKAARENYIKFPLLSMESESALA